MGQGLSPRPWSLAHPALVLSVRRTVGFEILDSGENLLQKVVGDKVIGSILHPSSACHRLLGQIRASLTERVEDLFLHFHQRLDGAPDVVERPLTRAFGNDSFPVLFGPLVLIE